MIFVDEATVSVAGGRGGNGCLSFRREKGVPHGGPDGGSGGAGGSVWLVADPSLNTLLPFQYRKQFAADRGRHGEGSDKHGRNGANIEVAVPPGTVVYDEDRVRVLADLSEPWQRFEAARGGRGGRGNGVFATSTNRTPTRHEEGGEGEVLTLRLELKLLADVAIIGFPNAGKSTLISRISAARPKIADYPFTTLVPNLGVVDAGGYRSFVVADIPGLIEGAHEGHGLGDRFLRHVERTRLLLHLVDLSMASGRDPIEEVEIINRELRAYGHGLDARPQIVVGSKLDALQDPARLDRLKVYCRRKRRPLLTISSVTGEGIETLVRKTWAALEKLPVASGQAGDRAKGDRAHSPAELADDERSKSRRRADRETADPARAQPTSIDQAVIARVEDDRAAPEPPRTIRESARRGARRRAGAHRPT